MTRIESDTAFINQEIGLVWNFLAELSNHRHIMPEQVHGWKSDGDTCEYTIAGTGSVHLKVTERQINDHLVLAPNGRIPFPFELRWQLTPENGGTRVQVIMDAELNAVLRMMAVRPLTNFMNLQIKGLMEFLDGK